MSDNAALKHVLPQMLSTQLLAADVYTTFVAFSRKDERMLWQSMLMEELAHIRFLSMMMEEEEGLPAELLPAPKMEAFRQLCDSARQYAGHSPFERTLWALRLEHAEIDYGLESMTSRSVSGTDAPPVCPEPLEGHYRRLIEWAHRYDAAREITMQISRLEEHLPSEIREPNHTDDSP